MADLLGTLALVHVVELAVTAPSKALAEFCCNYIVVFISIISSSAVSNLPRWVHVDTISGCGHPP